MRRRITVAAIVFSLSMLFTGCTSANEPIRELVRESHEQSIVVPKVKATNREDDSIALTISNEGYAAGYEVYRATETNSDYIYLDTVIDEEFVDSTIEDAKKYSYKVRAYISDDNKTRYSNFSNIVSVEAELDTPQNVEVDKTKEMTTISFDRVDRATEYKVYRSEEEGKDGSYIGSTSDNKYMDANAEIEQTYYYQVRAYAVIDYVEYNSALSSPVSSEQLNSIEQEKVTDEVPLVEQKSNENPSTEVPQATREPQQVTDSNKNDTVVESVPETTIKPTVKPTIKPTVKPTSKPTVKPTTNPTSKPVTPTTAPTKKPSGNGFNGFGDSIIIGGQNNSNQNGSGSDNNNQNDSNNNSSEEDSSTSGNKTSLAKQVLTLVNEERVKAGLKEVTMSSSITNAATKRSTEIITSFSHTRPNGSQPQTVLSEYGISYNTFGENIAYGQQTAKAVMNAWMNSEGHRANILNNKFGKIGIGCVEKNGVLYWTQLFTN